MQIFRPWSDQRVTAMATHAFKYSRPVDSKPFTQDIALSDWRARFSTSPSTSFGVWTPSTYTTADLMSLAQTIFAARNGLSLSEAQQVLSAQILFESQTPLTAYFTFLESLWRTLDSHPNHENDSSIVQWMRSHQFSGFSCEELLERTRSRLRENSSEEFEALDQLTLKIVETDWGRGLLECQGLSGCMTDALFDSDALAALKAKGDKAPWADRFFFLEAPTVRATQERFKIFQKLTKDLLKDYIKSKDIVTLASLPCGRMRDLLTLDYSKLDINKIRLLGIDLDPESVASAHQFYEELSCHRALPQISFMRANALALDISKKITILNSNGLTIYLDNDERRDFFQKCFDTLEPGGAFIVSHLTPPECWNMKAIDQNALKTQMGVFGKIIKPAWENYFREDSFIRAQLTWTGFVDIFSVSDFQSMFTSFLARKPE